ncbi:MAG: hypothetical protein DWQ19_09565 [Crenarchaeota archaeon]|mgnify:CR=1 FL=1|nr:MAG: hypothetical protein DWQ19_09565 [Thermoproteota archaeon]
MKNFAEWEEGQFLDKQQDILLEMSARRSFWRTIGKFVQQGNITLQKPVAILTAFRADIPGNSAQKLIKNRKANRRLQQKLLSLGFSFYPVLGVGQEEDKEGNIHPQKEESFVVQPQGDMPNDEFVQHIKTLCFDDKGDHCQWGSVVKLPGEPIVMIHHGGNPQSPEDYNQVDKLGNDVKIRDEEPYYAQMTKGPPRQFVTHDRTQQP